MELILASSSPYRKSQLQRLGLEFSCYSPDVDESALPQETAEVLSQRLAKQKAQAVAAKHPNAWVIGSDQVACLDSHLVGKPGNRENAIAQLKAAAGQQLDFYVGLCLMQLSSRQCHLWLETYSVQFRSLSARQIEHYVDIEQPYNCAGSFRSESLGIALFSKMWGNDPNTLIGMPLISLIDKLIEVGFEII